jgi:hypothetical protein
MCIRGIVRVWCKCHDVGTGLQIHQILTVVDVVCSEVDADDLVAIEAVIDSNDLGEVLWGILRTVARPRWVLNMSKRMLLQFGIKVLNWQ